MTLEKTGLLGRITLFLSGNLVAQALGAISGLLLARWLTIEEYALYTIVFLLMGAISVLTKGGIHLGFTAILGRSWPNMERAAQAMAAALSARRLLSALILPPVLLVSAWLLHRNGATPIQVGLLVFLLLLFWWADMRTRVVDQILFFAQKTSRIQALDSALACARLILIAILYATGLLDLISVVLLAVILAWWRIGPIKTWIQKLLPQKKESPIAADLQEIRLSVYRQFPSDLFQVFQVQIIIFLITVFATSNEVAGYGALLRLHQLMLPAQSLMLAFAVPYFSKSTNNLPSKYLALVIMASLPGVALAVVAWIAPHWLLWLLGPNYSTLIHEVWIASVVTALANMATAAWMLVANKGWLKWSWLQIPLGLLWCFIAPLYLLDMRTLADAILFGAGFSASLLVSAGMGIYSHNKATLYRNNWSDR